MTYRSLVTWVVFLSLALGIIAHEATDIFKKQPPPKTGQLPMFTFLEKHLWKVEVLYQGKFAFFQRDDRGRWFLHDGSHTHESLSPSSASDSQEPHFSEADLSLKIEEQLKMTARMIADRKMSLNETVIDNRGHRHNVGGANYSDDISIAPCEAETEESRSTEASFNCSSLERFGLENPPIILSFYSLTFSPRETNEPSSLLPLATLYAGDMLPSKYTYYTKKGGDPYIYLIPRYFIAMLLALAFGEDQAPSPMPEK